MIVNGVTLPDIPADVLASYPNAMITLAKNNTLGTETYTFWASSTEFIYLSQEAFPEAENTLSSLNDFMSAAYDEDESAWKDESVFPAGTNLLLTVNAGLTTLDIIWSNHDIYEVASVNEETGEFTYGDIYFANSEESKPDRVSIGRSLVDGYAKEVQRLTGTTDQMNAIQIREKLSTVKAGIKIGDTVLPPIPEDVLAEFPYAAIGRNATYNLYFLGMSVTALAYLPAELNSFGNNYVTSTGVGYKLYVYSNNAWVLQEESTTDRFTNGVDENIEFLWSNHNIYTATAYDSETGPTVGTEIYFSERQNFNGVWLPKIPEDVLAEYPYVSIYYSVFDWADELEEPMGGDYISFSLVYTKEKPNLMPSSIVESFTGEDSGGLDAMYYKSTPISSSLETGQYEWTFYGEEKSLLAVGIMGTEGFSIISELIWSNHDIYEITSIDSSTGEYTTGGLYFPPLPAIDEDRVSIGYDLFDGIVEEVQRLSDTPDKMNALRAYWKLTTVV